MSEIPVIPAGGEVEFQAHLSDSQNGHGWKIKTNANAGDIYLQHSNSRMPVHVSHHHSGQWHYTLENASSTVSETRHFSISLDRPELAIGWKHASRIVIFKDDAVNQSLENTIKVPFHKDYDAISMDLFISEVGAPNIKIPLAFPICYLELGDGRLGTLIAQPCNYVDSPQEAFPEVLTDSRAQFSKLFRESEPVSVIVICDTEENYGYLLQVEMKISM